MSFIWPPALLLLLLIPFGMWGYVILGRRRRERAAKFADVRAFAGATTGSGTNGGAGSGTGARAGSGAGPRPAATARRYLPGFFVLAGVTLLFVALARPQAVVGIPQNRGTLMIVIDTSGSMAADDLKPSRIAAAKAAAKDLVMHEPDGVVIGVVAFSDSGISVQVPTKDQDTVLAAINRQTPQRGTSLGQGINAALKAIAVAAAGPNQNNYYSNQSPAPTLSPTPVPPGTYTTADIVLFTDGENTVNPDPVMAAQAAADQGVRIYTVGEGTEAGTTLKINGFSVHTQLDPSLLQQVSQMTGGAYFASSDQQGIDGIYDHLDTSLTIVSQSMEITSILAGASILALIVGGLSSLFWTGRLP